MYKLNTKQVRMMDITCKHFLQLQEVTHIDKNFEVRRETIRSQVFRPGYNLPTMSLQEFADNELKEAKEREEREKQEYIHCFRFVVLVFLLLVCLLTVVFTVRNAPQPDRRYDQLVRDGDEDDETLANKATYKDRAWDDWKDAHPRGAGNKPGPY